MVSCMLLRMATLAVHGLGPFLVTHAAAASPVAHPGAVEVPHDQFHALRSHSLRDREHALLRGARGRATSLRMATGRHLNS